MPYWIRHGVEWQTGFYPARYTPQMSGYKNKHGRRPGRGARPWLLIPKVLSVGALLGGFMGAAVLLHTNSPTNHEQWAQLIGTVSTLFTKLIVPAVLCVVVFGLLLFLLHPKVFMKMRWFQVKVVLLILTIPPLHLTGRWLIEHARQALAADDLQRVSELMSRFTWTVDLAVLALCIVIAIGRQKPRLWQRPKPYVKPNPGDQGRD